MKAFKLHGKCLPSGFTSEAGRIKAYSSVNQHICMKTTKEKENFKKRKQNGSLTENTNN